MGSWIRCACGGLIYTYSFYKMIKDSDYDALEEPLDEDKLSDLFWKKGITTYRCARCGRLAVEWDETSAPTFYLPEKEAVEEESAIEAALAGIGRRTDENRPTPREPAEGDNEEDDQGEDPRLKELEALAEAEYSRMYDSMDPRGSYSDAKEAFYAAIARAVESGRHKDAKRLEKRLQHVKDVFRHQFS